MSNNTILNHLNNAQHNYTQHNTQHYTFNDDEIKLIADIILAVNETEPKHLKEFKKKLVPIRTLIEKQKLLPASRNAEIFTLIETMALPDSAFLKKDDTHLLSLLSDSIYASSSFKDLRARIKHNRAKHEMFVFHIFSDILQHITMPFNSMLKLLQLDPTLLPSDSIITHSQIQLLSHNMKMPETSSAFDYLGNHEKYNKSLRIILYNLSNLRTVNNATNNLISSMIDESKRNVITQSQTNTTSLPIFWSSPVFINDTTIKEFCNIIDLMIQPYNIMLEIKEKGVTLQKVYDAEKTNRVIDVNIESDKVTSLSQLAISSMLDKLYIEYFQMILFMPTDCINFFNYIESQKKLLTTITSKLKEHGIDYNNFKTIILSDPYVTHVSQNENIMINNSRYNSVNAFGIDRNNNGRGEYCIEKTLLSYGIYKMRVRAYMYFVNSLFVCATYPFFIDNVDDAIITPIYTKKEVLKKYFTNTIFS